MLLEICSQPTDDHIRRILEKPPTTLTELYCLVLSRIAAIGRSKEAIDCFKFVAVAKRPLAVDELQEAMAVEPYAKASQPGRLINNISQIFTWFGGLVIREEINDTVRFVHSTVLQAISDQRQISPQKWAYINPQQADKDVGIVCATYLNFDDFKTQVAHRSKLQDVDAAVLLDASLQEATPLLAKFLQSLPSRRLQRQQLPISRIPELAGTALSNRTLRTDDNTHPLLEYASIYWLSHSRHFSNVERIWSLWKPLLSDDHQLAKKPSEITRDPRKLKEEIIHQWHFALLLWDQLGQRSLDAQNITLIINYACDARATTFLSSFFNHCAQLPLDSNILFKVFSTVAESRDQDIARIISNSQFVNDTTNHRTFRHDHMFLRFQREYDLVLHLAVIAGDTELIRNLADGVNVDGIVALEGGRYSGRWSALSAAASIGNSAAVKILVGFGADINAYVNLRFTALGAAAHSGHAEVVGELLSLGANVNAAPAMYYGRTALQASAEGGHMEIVAKFLSIGAHVNAAPAEYRGRTALQAAAGSGHTEVVAKLLSIGADVNAAPAEFDGRTALQAAAGNRHTEIVAQLLTAGADVNAAPANLYGRTALQAAAESGDAVLVAQLLSTGADVNAAPAEIDGRTALQFAAGIGHAVVVAKLLSAGADVNAAPAKFDGRTALQAAAANNHCNVLAKLISAGADVNAAPAEFDGRTALQAAAEHGHAEIVTELLSAGADVNAAPAKSKGRTALQAARETGTAEIARLLLAASAEETEY
jgi:ankyrin repeat protein